MFAKLFYSKNAAFFQNEASIFLETEFSKMLNPSIIALLKEVQASEEDEVVILSSSPSFLVKQIAAKLSVEHVLATDYALDSWGNFSFISLLVDGNKKAEYVEDLLKDSHYANDFVVAYSDSCEDLPLLENANRAIVVNPSRKLKQVALKNGWPVY